MTQLSYIDTKYKPQRSDLICEFYVKPASGVSLKTAAENIASESSIGTWTDIYTMNKKIARKLKPSVFYINQNTGIIKIAYPLDLFEPGNIPQLMSSVGGNIFGMKLLQYLRLEDIHFPMSYLKYFKGPKYGIPGIRNLLRINKRPLVGTIIKPKIGLNAKQHANVAFEAWVGGIDAVKDDENLTNMSFNRFTDRVAATLCKRDRAEGKTGERKVYFPNITAPFSEMLKRAEYVKKQGGEYVMIDVITTGWSALQSFRDMELGFVIHAHRAGHGMFTELKQHGMSMLTVAKLCRLAGVDQLHVGAIVGKMKGEAKEVEHIGEEISEHFIKQEKSIRGGHVLEQEWGHIKSVFPVCSGGLHPGLVESLVNYMGQDIIIQAGGGVHGHPKGTEAGARAMRQAIDAATRGVYVREYAKTHEELRDALKKWVSV